MENSIDYRNTFTRQTTYNYRNRSFTIYRDEKRDFWGVESKYIVENKLTVQLNGITGYIGKTISETLEKVTNRIDMDYYMDECGMDYADSMILTFKMDLTDEQKKTFREALKGIDKS